MTNTVQLLKQASDMEAKSYASYVTSFTSSGIARLVTGGISFEKAASLMREACETDSTLSAIKANIVAFEKSAEYITELESKVLDLEKSASEIKPTNKKPDADNPMSKLASAGFSAEEIEMISQLPENLMTKVANVGSQPWEMGGGAGMAREKTDPMLEFLLG